MTTEPPRLQTVDDRRARIEDFLIKLSTGLDRVEQHLSAIRALLPEPNRQPGMKDYLSSFAASPPKANPVD
jgi:hypothetical protein